MFNKNSCCKYVANITHKKLPHFCKLLTVIWPCIDWELTNLDRDLMVFDCDLTENWLWFDKMGQITVNSPSSFHRVFIENSQISMEFHRISVKAPSNHYQNSNKYSSAFNRDWNILSICFLFRYYFPMPLVSRTNVNNFVFHFSQDSANCSHTNTTLFRHQITSNIFIFTN